jgi:hypothetical protein
VAGYREFQTGEVLTAANVNDFLMEQSVMTFADDAARAAALSGVLREGILTYNEDTAQLEVYDGSAFVLAAPAPPVPVFRQVVRTTTTAAFSTTSTSFVDAGQSVTITPTRADSKIILMVSESLQNNSTSHNVRLQITDASNVAISGAQDTVAIQNPSGVSSFIVVSTIMAQDAPNTTSAKTYKLRARVSDGTGTLRAESTRQMFAFEVA